MESLHYPIEPGTLIKLDDISELPAFEDLVADIIDPNMADAHLQLWDGRQHVRDLIRPKGFNGRYLNIVLESIPDPYEHLQSAKERGWTYPAGTVRRSEKIEEWVKDLYLGFTFSAEAYRSGKGTVGLIESELYYYPTSSSPPRILMNGPRQGKFSYDSNSTNSKGSVGRFVLKPQYDPNKFMESNLASQAIGVAVLRSQLDYPIIAPHR